MYAVGDAMKKLDWYAFGKTPLETAKRVAQVLSAAKSALFTDLSKFDGHVGKAMRSFEEIMMRTLFDEEDQTELVKLMKTQQQLKGRTMNGICYENEYGRLSGSPETSVFNSLQNAFMAYATYREMGQTPEEAWASLGIYGGDDGVSGDASKTVCEKVATGLGHAMEAQVLQRGEPGVNFLARIYSPNVWTGGLDSCTDIRRALAKLHTSTNLTVPAETKLFEKCFALSLSDLNTPILGQISRRALELRGNLVFTNLLQRWMPDWQKVDEQYPNANDMNWMNDLLTVQGLDGFRLIDFQTWLTRTTSLTDLLHSPEFIERPPIVVPPTKTVEINGELHVPANVKPVTQPAAASAEGDMEEAIADYKKKGGRTQHKFPKIHVDQSQTSATAAPTTTLSSEDGPISNKSSTSSSQPGVLERDARTRSSMSAKPDKATRPHTRRSRPTGQRKRSPQ